MTGDVFGCLRLKWNQGLLKRRLHVPLIGEPREDDFLRRRQARTELELRRYDRGSVPIFGIEHENDPGHVQLSGDIEFELDERTVRVINLYPGSLFETNDTKVDVARRQPPTARLGRRLVLCAESRGLFFDRKALHRSYRPDRLSDEHPQIARMADEYPHIHCLPRRIADVRTLSDLSWCLPAWGKTGATGLTTRGVQDFIARSPSVRIAGPTKLKVRGQKFAEGSFSTLTFDLRPALKVHWTAHGGIAATPNAEKSVIRFGVPSTTAPGSSFTRTVQVAVTDADGLTASASASVHVEMVDPEDS
jgi:hypothetical protein